MLALGLACYATGSLAGGLASGPAMMIAMRRPGRGRRAAYPGHPGPDRDHVRRRARQALAAWGAAGSGGLAAGSLLGGVLTSSLGWRWVFFVNVSLACIALAALPPDARPRLGHFDLGGGLVGTASASLIVYALVTGPEQGWGSAGTLLGLCGGLALIAVLAVTERKVADPLALPGLLAHRSRSPSSPWPPRCG
jgi:MFS family permease